MSVLHTLFGDFNLERWPASSDRSLQAWDAADELLISHVHEFQQAFRPDNPRLLICNDSHGALGCALHAFNPVNWSDSCLAHTALVRNWQRNGLPDKPECLESLTTPEGRFDVILIKIPKTHALLEDQLARIRPLVNKKTVVVAACLVRHLQRTAFALFERYLGAVTTSLAVKKARLVFCTPEPHLPAIESPYPDVYTDPDLELTLANHANVFCRDRVDTGTRFFISNYSRLPHAGNVIDLACGNGILGICVQREQPQARLHFIDESYMAVASARHNFSSIIADARNAPVFTVGNGLAEVDSNSTDLIICNPPFHVQHAIADDTAQYFFKHAARCLRSEGQMWVVANRHLRYLEYMKRYLDDCGVVASNNKFVLLKASARTQR